ncbi:hypothetical protein CWE12_00045 [Aliidiomarina sedimenti]|uniref:Uncharacterized protein n=1 Tax=Aliidiomarina sedimenti TaxID=1933879 RepID=A0ABY0C0Q9_9GAMM|nr:hypothetical protein [Aliidiomarina sedimenti]RUO31431.1 hypothetical protein CWE12_00045 [Aliidiomarina sedimenti]
MAFQEKSAWIMLGILLVLAAGYFIQVGQLSAAAGEVINPQLAAVVKFTVAIIVWSVISHVALALFWPKDAQQKLDERERRIHDRAGHLSGLVLGFGLVTALGYFLVIGNANVLFYMGFASLILSQLSEYVFRIFNYRRSF